MYSIHFSPSSSSLRAKFPLKTFLFTPLDFINFLLPRSSEFSPRIGNCSPAERSSFATPHWSVLIRWRLSKKLNYFRSWQSEIKEIIICPRVSLLEYDACDTLPAELIQITEYSVFQPQTLWRKYVRTSGIFQLNFPDTFWAFSWVAAEEERRSSSLAYVWQFRSRYVSSLGIGSPSPN